MDIRMPEDVEAIINRLVNAGFEAYIVGGCVRDSLMGKIPDDWDITTSARPKQVKKVFDRTIDTGIQHGTVTVIYGRTGYEITTYRIDGEYEDGRHPREVAYTSHLLEDLKRRDFTINAMAFNSSCGLVDVFGGQEDLLQGVIRCVGSPEERFQEDALRMMRAVRFAAQLGFEIENNTLKGIRTIAPNLKQVSRERVQMELTKILQSCSPGNIQAIYELGLAPYISEPFSELPWQKDGFSLCLAAAARLKNDKALRWGMFLGTGNDGAAEHILQDLKMDKETIAKVKILSQWLFHHLPVHQAEIRKVMSQMPAELFIDLVECKLALVRESHKRGKLCSHMEREEELLQIREASRMILDRGDCLYLNQLALTGKDLIAAGKKPGKEMGSTLRRLLAIVLEHPEWNTRERLLEEALFGGEAQCPDERKRQIME